MHNEVFSIEQYNEEIDEIMAAMDRGEVVSHGEVVRQSIVWISLQ